MKTKRTLIHIFRPIAIIAVIIAVIAAYINLVPTINSKFSISAIRNDSFNLTAHRGLSAVAPENSAPALEEAGKAGFYAAEFDIMPTKDGKWILMHDDTLDRTTNGTGNIENFTYAELLELTIDSGNGIENYPELKISTLEEALDICEKYSMRAMIEIKGGSPADMTEVLEIVKSKNLKTEPLIIDFSSERIEALRKADDKIELWYLVNLIEEEDIDFCKNCKAGIAFNFGRIKNYSLIEKAQKEKITCASWTVDYLPFMDILSAFGVDYITTNRILP